MLRNSFILHLEHICSEIENKQVKLRAYEKIYGGDINITYRLVMTYQDYFIKINDKHIFPVFELEAKSLQILNASNSFRIPKVFKVGEFKDKSYLLMEFIESLNNTTNPINFAENLVKLHKNTNEKFGLYFDNYIGSLSQYNNEKDNWINFYIGNRLQYQINLAQQKNLIPNKIINYFDKLFQKLPNLLIEEKPSLLHGDLWNGNYFYDTQGKAVIFDPAVYYGNREIDLAMMSLFGGFENEIYSVYNNIFPLETDWKERLKIYQLYPLLVHLNLFGNSYLNAINDILKFFI